MLVSTSMLIFCLIWNENYRAYSAYINSPNCITEPTTAPARAPKLTAEVKAALEMRRLTYRKVKLLPFSIELIQYRAVLMVKKAHISTTRNSCTGSGESELV